MTTHQQLQKTIDSLKRQLREERALRKNPEKELLRFRAAIESASDAIVIQDDNKARAYFNPAFSKLFEWPMEKMKTAEKTLAVFDDLDEAKQMFQTVYRGESWRREMVMKSLVSRRTMEMMNHSDAIKDENGKIVGIFSVYTDITEQKKAQRCLQEVHQQLLEAHNALEVKVEERTKELKEVIDKLEAEIEERKRLAQENDYLHQEIKEKLNFGFIVGDSPPLKKVLEQVELVAPTDASVLIAGESGTGKELIARAIHENSPRSKRPLVKVNCASIPDNLFESEFFGHVKGAFTGAMQNRIGRFELADKGTLFLDEIGEIPLPLQSKFLRVLQEKQFEKVGETKTRQVDVRVIAATNRNLEEEVKAGNFRKDLYYRLSVFPMEIPSLKERQEDILPLAEYFIRLFAKRLAIPPPKLSAEDILALENYSWPGNIRELQNVMERYVILSQRGRFQLSLSAELEGDSKAKTPRLNRLSAENLTLQDLKNLEREILLNALEHCHWKIYGTGGAAEYLGMPPTTLTTKMAKQNIKNKKKLR